MAEVREQERVGESGEGGRGFGYATNIFKRKKKTKLVILVYHVYLLRRHQEDVLDMNRNSTKKTSKREPLHGRKSLKRLSEVEWCFVVTECM
ncbi:Protein of unknown function [Gryllus bimaculatus]|nr:Protein of unknown function [Gryllus bimaculatus]